MPKLLSRLCLVCSLKGIQRAHSAVNFHPVTRCACPRADRHSKQQFVMCYYLISWVFIPECCICSVIRGRPMCSVMLPWVTEERRQKGPSHQTAEVFFRLDLACGQRLIALSSSAISVPSFAMGEHVTYVLHESILIYTSSQ